MPKQGARAEINSFVGGLITEASPLNFPPNACIDLDNFELNRDGTLDRRLGMDYEANHTLRSVGLFGTETTAAVSTFKWTSVNGKDGVDFVVFQYGYNLHISDLTKESISGSGYLANLELPSLPYSNKWEFATVDGKLVIASGAETVAVVTHNSGSSFSVEYIRLMVRDQWGVQDAGQYETDKLYRDGTAYASHLYNLRNQSWALSRKNGAGTVSDPITIYLDKYGLFPSNSETVWPGLQFKAPEKQGEKPTERIEVELYADVFGADLLAPKGFFIIDLLRRGTSRMSEYSKNHNRAGNVLNYPSVSIPSDFTNGGATLVTEFAGRVFYAGFGGEVTAGDKRSPYLANYIAFSRLVNNIPDIGKCYQEGDPTSRENSDLVDTDGGLVRISGAEKIIGMKSIGTTLIIIATNGVWALSGGSDYGFSATNYLVKKLSSYGGLSASSIVEDGSSCYFWAADGIYVVAADQYGDLKVTNISQPTIQKYYDEIPNLSKRNCVGIYDKHNKKVRWLYKQGTLFTSSSITKELVLDTMLNCFYPNTIGRLEFNNTEVVGMVTGSPFYLNQIVDEVEAGADDVLAGTDTVTITEPLRTSGVQSVRYVTLVRDGFLYHTYSLYANTEWLDWKKRNGVGVDVKAFIMTGAQTAGDSSIHKQIPYLVMHFRRTELTTDANGVPQGQSSCKVRTQWDWANSAASKKWTSMFQAYRPRKAFFAEGAGEYDTGFETVISKNKIRGRGRAFSIYMETEPGKDCRILGWNLTINGNALA